MGKFGQEGRQEGEGRGQGGGEAGEKWKGGRGGEGKQGEGRRGEAGGGGKERGGEERGSRGHCTVIRIGDCIIIIIIINKSLLFNNILIWGKFQNVCCGV